MTSRADIRDAVRGIGVPGPRPVLVLIGGAAHLAPEVEARLQPTFERQLSPLLTRLGACVVDGGTDAGVMRLAGRALGTAVPVVGVLPQGQAARIEANETATGLEPTHAGFLTVPGDVWGDESRWLFDVAEIIASGEPVVTVLVGGGDVATGEIGIAASLGLPVVVVADSGGTANAIAAAKRGPTDDQALTRLASFDNISVAEPADFVESVRRHFEAAADRPIAPPLSLAQLVDRLDLPMLEKDLLRSRWLEQVRWLSRRARGARIKYRALHLTTVTGGVILPAVVSYILGEPSADVLIRTAAFVLSLVVAITAALEEVLHYGDTWRQYRATAEALKSEGWAYLYLAGAYGHHPSHIAAYRDFAERTEAILRDDVAGYFEKITESRTASRPSVL